MDSQDLSLSQSDGISQIEHIHTGNTAYSEINLSAPSTKEERPLTFWRMRLIEAGMFISMALYYLVANPNIHIGSLHIPLQNLNPLYSLPFLLIFAILCWFRLPIAIALLPVSLPYYYIQKNVTQSARFSLVEITLYTCVAIALLQYVTALIRHKKWRYQLSWSDLCDRFGPFLWPVVIFFLAALVSITIAYSRSNAERAFREEILGPLLYLVLAFLCLRSRQDIARLVLALLGSGLLIALLGCIQYFLFRNTITPDVDGIRRITTVYGSGNNIGVFFDYTLPIGFALLLSCFAWRWRLIALICCIPFAFVLYQSGSRGSFLLAMPVALLFVIVFAIRNRRALLISSIAFVLVCAIVGGIYSQNIISFVIYGHTSSQGDSTALKRPLLWLTALNMIHDSPWLGYGMDNWLCHYSDSWKNTCLYPNGFPPGANWNNGISTNPPLHAYWIIRDAHGNLTGMDEEPDLSHPHNIFLQVWVSIGIFGLLAFIATIILFYWLFARLLRYLATIHPPQYELLRLLLISIGAAMLAALVQGQVDSSFLEQDLAFCFWTLIATLLLLRAIIGMPWRFLLGKR